MKKYLSPAKLNLFLKVINKRPDNYHNIQTVFVLVNFFDTIKIKIRSENKINFLSNNSNINLIDNLSFKAADLLKKKYKIIQGADIFLEKKIPIGAGLGGGSSNAATTLLALNRLWNIGLSNKELRSIGLELGADVPAFIFGETCYAEGIGDKLRKFEKKDSWYVVLFSREKISTAKIFSALELTQNTKPRKISPFLEQNFANDFENIVCKKFPEVNKNLSWLRKYSNGRLSGTGGSVFGEFDSKEKAESIFNCRPKGVNGFFARGLKKHPEL